MHIHIALAAAGVLLAAHAVAAAVSTPSGGAGAGSSVPPGVVDGTTAHRLVHEGVKVIDVRTPAEFAAGHVPGAVNIPYDQMAQRHAEIGPPSTPVLLYCRTGNRSGVASKVLAGKGFSRIYDLQAYDRWVASEPAGRAR